MSTVLLITPEYADSMHIYFTELNRNILQKMLNRTKSSVPIIIWTTHTIKTVENFLGAKIVNNPNTSILAENGADVWIGGERSVDDCLQLKVTPGSTTMQWKEETEKAIKAKIAKNNAELANKSISQSQRIKLQESNEVLSELDIYVEQGAFTQQLFFHGKPLTHVVKKGTRGKMESEINALSLDFMAQRNKKEPYQYIGKDGEILTVEALWSEPLRSILNPPGILNKRPKSRSKASIPENDIRLQELIERIAGQRQVKIMAGEARPWVTSIITRLPPMYQNIRLEGSSKTPSTVKSALDSISARTLMF